MKNLLTLLVSLMLLGASQLVEAGAGEQGRIATRATQLTQQLAQKTQLSEGQYVKVRRLNLRLLTEVQTLQTRLVADPVALDKQLAEVQSMYEWDLATILWPRQMAAYTQAKADLMAFSMR